MQGLFLVTFPDFNIYSTPLLILVLQGLIFTVLLFARFLKRRQLSDGLLAVILLLTCYDQVSYTIGFMDWYDTYRNTKINYYLINSSLLVAPLLFFYVKSVTVSSFTFSRKDVWHFAPAVLYVLIRMVILIYDSRQPGFDAVQNGFLVENFQWKYLNPIVGVLATFQMLLYLAFSFQLFFSYRKRIIQFFSDTFAIELNWIRNFLYVYTFLFVYHVFQQLTDSMITTLSWTQEWWYYFFSAIAILYVGVKGYFTDTVRLGQLNAMDPNHYFEKIPGIAKKTDERNEGKDGAAILLKKEKLEAYMESETPYLDSGITLIDLAEKLGMNRGELSEVINVGAEKNFNDFVNHYRVEEVKRKLQQGEGEKYSLLAIALDCGFNSKATFNRVFKKLTGQSPSDYQKS